MQDEKKFFEDFNKNIDHIEPSPSFVEKMVSLAKEEPVSITKKFKPVYFVAAAAVILLVGVTSIQLANNSLNKPIATPEIQAGKEKESEEIKGGSIEGIVENVMDKLQKAVEEENSLVTNGKGDELTIEQKQDLITMLEKAHKLQNVQPEGVSEKYTVTAEDKYIFEIIDERYIIVNEEVYEIK